MAPNDNQLIVDDLFVFARAELYLLTFIHILMKTMG